MSNTRTPSSHSVFSKDLSPLQLALAAGLCVASVTAVAQEVTTLPSVTVTGTSENPLQPSAVPLPQFTAPLIDTPKTVQVITGEVMQQTGATSLSEALKTTPGITFGSGEGGNPTGDRPFMRGSDAQSSIFVDGLRDIAASNREVFNLESVEVIKGADSAYTGRGGAGGSINLTTKKAQDTDFAVGEVGLGTDQYKRTTIDVNRKVGETTGVRLNLMGHDADVPGRDGPTSRRWGVAPTITFGMNTPTEVTLGYEHLQSNDIPDGGVPFAAGSVAKFTQDTTIQPTYGGNRDNWYGLKDRDFRKEKSDVFTASITHKLDETTKIRNATRYSRADQDYIWTQPDDSQGNVPLGKVWRRMNSRYSETNVLQNVTDLSGQGTIGGLKHSYAIGVEFSREKSKVDGYSLVDAAGNTQNSIGKNRYSFNSNQCGSTAYPVPGMCTSLFDPNGGDSFAPFSVTRNNAFTHYRTNTASLYAFDTLTLSPEWLLNAGVRVDRYRTEQWDSTSSNSRTDTLFNYQLGVVYKLKPNASVYVSTGTSSTPGGASAGQGLEGQGITPGGRNPVLNADQLKPETTRSYEIGTKWDVLDNKLSLTAAIFRNETNNARVRDPNTSLAEMVGRKSVTGLELGFAGSLTPQWDVFGGYTYMDSEQKDIGTVAASDRYNGGRPAAGTGLAFPNTPKHSLSFWTSYKFTPQFTLGVGAVAQSDVAAAYAYSDNGSLITKSTPGYVRYDAMMNYAFTPNLSLQVNVYNLTNKVYYASTFSAHYATLGAGRSATATLRYEY